MIAFAKNGMNDSFTPSRASKESLCLARRAAIRVTSASTTVVSWAETCSDSTMRSAITLRRRVIFSVRAPGGGRRSRGGRRCGRCRGRRGGRCRGGRGGQQAQAPPGAGGSRRGWGSTRRRRSRGGAGGAVRRVEDVLLGDPATDAGPAHGRQVHAGLRGELADQRRDVEVRRCSAGVCPGAGSLRARGASAAGAGRRCRSRQRARLRQPPRARAQEPESAPEPRPEPASR